MFFVTGGELEYWNNTETDTGRNVFGQVCVVNFFFFRRDSFVLRCFIRSRGAIKENSASWTCSNLRNSTEIRGMIIKSTC